MVRRSTAAILVLSCSALCISAQTPTRLFDAPLAVLPEDGPPFQQLFDFDRDGDMDAVGTRVRSNGLDFQISVWRNTQGRFATALSRYETMTGGIGRTMHVATGDLDGDGDPDIAAACGFLLATYTNTGTDFVRSNATLAQRASDVAIADFDVDGRLDVAVLCREPGVAGAGFLELRLATGARVTSAIPAVLPAYSRLQILDLDGDTAPEVGVWNQRLHDFYGFDLAGNQINALPSLHAVLSEPTRMVFWAGGDIEGDGDDDVVAFELPTLTEPARVHAFRRSSATVFALEPAYLGGPAEMLADADGDGDLDGVCCGGSGQPTVWPMTDFGSFFEIAMNRGAGVFDRAITMPSKGSSRLAGISDVDGDGHLDYVAGACVYYGRGDLSSATAPETGVPSQEIFSVPTLGKQLLDHDRDGDPDFLFDLGRRGINDGTGAIPLDTAPPPVIPAGFTAGVPRFTGDFDGDGAPDLVVPLSLGGAFSHMELFRNNGSGKLFAAGAVAPPGTRIGWLYYPYVTGLDSGFASDVDGDGDVDIVANADASYEPQMRSEIWWNQGGQFTAGPVITGERIEVLADFDGDGIRDAVTRTGYPGRVRLRLGSGNPSAPFLPAPGPLNGQVVELSRDSVSVVEANGDGRPDLLVRTYLSATMRYDFELCCNTTAAPGSPSFAITTDLLEEGHYGASYALVFDVDRDGRNDLVQLGPIGGAWVARIRRRIAGDGLPLLPQHFAPPIDHVSHAGHPADADGDGDIDLIGSFTIRNLRYAGSTAGTRRQYGAGTPGEAGVVPLLGATGPFRVGATKQMRLSGIAGPTAGVLFISAAPADLPNFVLPGLRALVDPAVLYAVLPWSLSEPGRGYAGGAAALSFALPWGIQGLEFFEQVLLLDPAAVSGVAASNGLHVRIGD